MVSTHVQEGEGLRLGIGSILVTEKNRWLRWLSVEDVTIFAFFGIRLIEVGGVGVAQKAIGGGEEWCVSLD